MDRGRFDDLVEEALEGLPEEFADLLDSIAVVVEDWPTPAQLSSVGVRRRQDLLGLYEGVPLTRRGRNYGMVVPDKITIFQKPIEAKCKYEAEIVHEIQSVVRHEIAHHFGISDARLRQLEKGRD